MAADAIVDILRNISSGLVVYPKVIKAHIMAEIPFMATENIIMAGVKKGGDRQDLHERIRVHSMAAGAVVKIEGKPNDLLERIAADPAFALSASEIDDLLKPELYIGRSASQTSEFVNDVLKPAVAKDAKKKIEDAAVNV
jgi:adenylosuccinate lyase